MYLKLTEHDSSVGINVIGKNSNDYLLNASLNTYLQEMKKA